MPYLTQYLEHPVTSTKEFLAVAKLSNRRKDESMITFAGLIIFTNIVIAEHDLTSNNAIAESNPHGAVNYISLFRGIFRQSGCYCREYLFKYATCYGPDECKRFPRTFTTELTDFKLATTGVENITAGDLDNYTNIESMQVNANNELQYIEAGTFLNMSRLKNLSISYNPGLLNLEENVFDGLTSLESLSIRQNGFADIKNFSLSLKFEFMPKLRKLVLYELRCPIVDKGDFINLNGSYLEELNLVESQVEYIHPEALLPLRNLRVLNLGENLINSTTLVNLLEALIENKISLSTLNLCGWGFKKTLPEDIAKIISKANLTRLILNRNQFDVISEHTFPYMLHLEALDLSDVLLSNLTHGAFLRLPHLKSLCLSKNKFSSVPVGALLLNLRRLDLSMNSEPYGTESYFTLRKYTFENMSTLEILDLSSNNIRKIDVDHFVGLTNLSYLSLKNCNIFFVDRKSFAQLKRLKFLSLENSTFPTRSFHKDIFEGLGNLEKLELGYCNIKTLPEDIFVRLKSLKHLDLHGNKLKMINPVIFNSLISLRVLNVGENRLTVWHEQLFKRNRNLTVFKIHDNKLTYFTKAMLEDMMSLVELDVSKNPYNCECKSFDSFSKLNAHSVNRILNLTNSSMSKCVYPDKYTEFNFVDYYEMYFKNECSLVKEERLIGYLVPSLILLTVTIMVIITAYIYRWHIRYWIFLTKMFLSRRAQFNRSISLQGHDNYVYDAFVSYSSEDRNFVVRLVAMLENYEPFLKLCVYERDFEIGTIISESVLECVSRSRKTLLVISNSYIKSQWCRWEAQVAENHRLFFENEQGECVNDSIIMIKLGNISQNNLSPMLKYLMKTRIYLQWDSEENKQKQFWEKLRNALAPPMVPNTILKVDSSMDKPKD